MGQRSVADRVERTRAPGDGAGARAVHRVEVSHREGVADPRAQAVRRDARALGAAVESVRIAQVYLIEAALTAEQVGRIAQLLLASPILDEWSASGTAPIRAKAGAQTVEVHPLPGVMDPAAQTVLAAVREITGAGDARVTTGRRYDFIGVTSEQADMIARRLLANPVVHAIHHEPFLPQELPRGTPHAFEVRRVAIRDLSDAQLEKLSRDAHLFLSLDEMCTIRDEYRKLDREPTDIELETLAQTWSEHCVHKTLKSRIRYRGAGKPGDPLDFRGRPGHEVQPDGVVIINNLLKSTVAAATHELIADGVDWTLSVFVDNAGVIEFDETTAVCVKVETHNHPSAIEPYGGAATGVGGCIRDVIGTGLGARPIANMDVFCVAYPWRWRERGGLNAEEGGEEGLRKTEGGKSVRSRERASAIRTPAASSSLPEFSPPFSSIDSSPSSSVFPLPAGALHPKRVLTDVVAGVRDYGNRMGIPTVNGAVWFDDRHVGNPLVFCGCVGVLPRELIRGAARPGDRIIALGGRTGRDGIHGATFSSAELTDTHADEFSHAVQIGNAIEEKRVMDAILRARDVQGGPLYSAITDCGAGGFSSAVGEMGAELGAQVELERAPLKYEGLSYTEIWISEAQERMVLAVAPERLAALRAICDEESVEMSDLGVFGTPGAELILRYDGREVGRLPMEFLHEGIPQPVREAEWRPGAAPGAASAKRDVSTTEALLALLGHPNIASKRWIVRQYDHEVQGATVLKPLVGPAGDGPGDAAVIQPVPGAQRALAIANGLATGVGDPALGGDSYLMALAAIDECVRNLVCVGADPDRIAILDNFCWPSCAKQENLATLVRAAEGCYDGAKAYRTPFVSGKDSLNNQFTTEDGVTIEIPPTLLISGIGLVRDRMRCVTMDAKRAGGGLVVVGRTTDDLGGSHLQKLTGGGSPMPRVDLEMGPRTARAVAGLIDRGLVRSAHDCSEGGALVAIAEMLIAAADARGGDLGATVDIESAPGDAKGALARCFAETPSRYVLEIAPERLDEAMAALLDAGVAAARVGALDDSGRLRARGAGVDEPVSRLKEAWLAPLDW